MAPRLSARVRRLGAEARGRVSATWPLGLRGGSRGSSRDSSWQGEGAGTRPPRRVPRRCLGPLALPPRAWHPRHALAEEAVTLSQTPEPRSPPSRPWAQGQGRIMAPPSSGRCPVESTADRCDEARALGTAARGGDPPPTTGTGEGPASRQAARTSRAGRGRHLGRRPLSRDPGHQGGTSRRCGSRSSSSSRRRTSRASSSPCRRGGRGRPGAAGRAASR